MAHTYTQLLTHIVFSTKHRFPFIDAELQERLFPYMGGIIRQLDGIPILVNGVADHVHLLAFLPARMAVSDVLRTVKSNSSRWVHEQFSSKSKFEWQTGYAAFSVSRWDLEKIKNYIANQEEHHRKKTFQEEFLQFLKEYEIEYDERYIWD
ncbi:MAG: IS200/IS605 family transposase [Ignavibacteriales bacterium]|nr:IS200/IS605 family transposase [Ignavibacteriales bacterium]